MYKVGIVQSIPVITIIILGIVYPFVSNDSLQNYMIGFYAVSIAISSAGLFIALWGIKRTNDFHGHLMNKKCLVLMHVLAYLANISLNITAISVLSSNSAIGMPWYEQPKSAYIVAIFYCIKSSITMIFFLVRFFIFSKNDWH